MENNFFFADKSINLKSIRQFLDNIKTLDDDLETLKNDIKRYDYSIIISSFFSGCSIFAPNLNIKLLFITFAGVSAYYNIHNTEIITIETEIYKVLKYILSRIRGYLELLLQNLTDNKSSSQKIQSSPVFTELLKYLFKFIL